MLTDERIREIYLSCGFTVKPGQTDLKPYVFESARAIEAEATAPLLQRIAELERFKDAYDAWQEKTEWVQTTATAGELGKHRADVLRERIEKLKSALSAAPVAQPEPVAWCHLTPSGKVGYFDGKPMVMFGSVGNEHHETPLYAGIKDQP